MQFYTPSRVVRVLVDRLAPYKGRVNFWVKAGQQLTRPLTRPRLTRVQIPNGVGRPLRAPRTWGCVPPGGLTRRGPQGDFPADDEYRSKGSGSRPSQDLPHTSCARVARPPTNNSQHNGNIPPSKHWTDKTCETARLKGRDAGEVSDRRSQQNHRPRGGRRASRGGV